MGFTLSGMYCTGWDDLSILLYSNILKIQTNGKTADFQSKNG